MLPSTASILRLLVFIPISVINLFLIPVVVPKYNYYGVLSRLTAVSTLIGLPAIVLGPFGPIHAYHHSKPPGFPIPLYGLMSIFDNPNAMGAIAVFGALAAMWEYFFDRSILSLLLFIINSSGVYFSQSRAAILALIAGVTVVGIYCIAGQETLHITTYLGLVSAPTIVLIKFGIIPGPELIQSIDFNNRVELWTAAYHAFLDRPLIGWGIGNVPDAMRPYLAPSFLKGMGPHTSYIRMFAATGIIGGVLYLYIHLRSISCIVPNIKDNSDATEYALVIAGMVIHTFSGISIFGLAITSVVPAIILGYAQLYPDEK